MVIRWQRELPQWALLAAMFGLSAALWSRAPETLPVHWNLAGEVDRYGSKAEALLVVPFIALALYVVLLAAPRLVRATEAQLGGIYTAVRIAALVLMAVIHVLLLAPLGGVQVDMGRVMPLLIGVLFIGLGSVMGRVQPNAIMGVRTPWTLSSRAAWDASQRLGGRLFLVIGAVFALAGLLGLGWLALAGLAALLVSLAALVWYGYRVSRADPERLPPGRTLIS